MEKTMKAIDDSIDDYHILYEKSRIWNKSSWLGVPCWKLPMDAFVIQELIVKNRPDFIIETGTGKGGSAIFYASICELLQNGEVITCDIDDSKIDWANIFNHDWANRIHFFTGDTSDELVFRNIESFIRKRAYELNILKQNNCMVILDSWHTKDHVYKEMEMYSAFVPVGGYMIVEDSHSNGNPVPWEWDDDGPMGAITKWIDRHDNWEIDFECEKHLLTFNPKGYLRRIK